ncbi:MAG: quinolinate synthase NadA [Alphaproteobacteria bacterium]|nr:quinolinate synthase NadA [Alphaproteobacteria bacterium]
MSSFPSLTITRDELVPLGDFAVAQASFLHPDDRVVGELRQLCEAHAIGIVAHFYMDAELQGVLVRVGAPHTFIADSLAMSDHAVRMAEAGKRAILVLGVDFMSENVRAVLDAAGYAHVPVYRLSDRVIGCSLAESAESPHYLEWLRACSALPNVLHVVYINTSLATKGRAHAVVPTITCTSSNVLQTLLQASAQIPDLTVAYGPDTYMGGNLAALLGSLQTLPDERIRELHPDHDRASIAGLLERFRYYAQGACVVHHLFGDDVVRRVREEHADALLTAHLEVPGEMFALAADAQRHGRGVVGSTSNILGFILDAVAESAKRPGPQRVPVVLGTESGMITSIVTKVQDALAKAGRDDIAIEIVFPVASEAVAQAPDSPLQLIPGVAAGEGCSVAGGCATCPYMKMNSLDALLDVMRAVAEGRAAQLSAYVPRKSDERIDGRLATDVGTEPILWMRHFQKTKRMPDALVERVTRGRG